MAIANSGTIGVSTIKSFWGAGANQVSAYYRGGGIVPSQKPGGLTPGNQKPGNPVPGNPSPCTANGYGPGGGNAQIYKSGNDGIYRARIHYNNGGWCGQPHGYGSENSFGPNKAGQCCHGAIPAGVVSGTSPMAVPSLRPSTGFNPDGVNPPGTNPPTTNPPVQTNPVPMNTGVPSSGRISLSNFYGGEK